MVTSESIATDYFNRLLLIRIDVMLYTTSCLIASNIQGVYLSLGAMVMSHSDDKGLVLPPPVAPLQVVIVPILKGENSPENELVLAKVQEMVAQLKVLKIRVKVDDRLNVRPGAKYFEWERKGVPIRLEIGPRDAAADTALLAYRHTGGKESVPLGGEKGAFGAVIVAALAGIHRDLLAAAKGRLKDQTYPVDSYAAMKAMMDTTSTGGEDDSGRTSGSSDNGSDSDSERKIGFYLAPWKCDRVNEGRIKEDCKATIRCYPLDLNQSPPPPGTKCFYSGDQATHMAIFARAF